MAAKSFARIHSANLINAGIIPLTFENEDDFNKLDFERNFSAERVGELFADRHGLYVGTA